MQIPGHVDHQEFAGKVHASFEVIKACNRVEKVDNYNVTLPGHPLMGKHCFLPLKDMRFGTQDIHLSQLYHTIAYARALQYWAKEVHPPVPDQHYHLARSVQELWWAMELLITFAGDVFMTTVPSKWMEITLPQSMEALPQEPLKNHTRSSRAHLRGSMSTSHSKGWSVTAAKQVTATKGAPATPPKDLMPYQPSSDSKPLCPPPRFAEFAQALSQEDPMESAPLPVITGIPSEEAIYPYEVVGMAMTVARLNHNQMTREMLVDIQIYSEGIMGLRLNSKADTHPALTLQEQLNSLPHHMVLILFSSGMYTMTL